uniref:ARAD1C45452p n=1 Tax=Blastobotrys adeninivorans TaxID=409370 RepID=A0A060T431_BLAAD
MEADPRIAFSQETGKWIFEDDDGAEYEYDEELGQWNPVFEQEEVQQQQEVYKRGREEQEEEDSTEPRKKMKSAKPPRPTRPPQTTAVYVTNLPKDVTRQEMEQAFAKYGVLAEDLKTGEKKIKLYTDEEGQFKGDALVVYFKPESVSLAIELMDDTFLRPTDKEKIRIQKAQFNHKQEKTSSEEKPVKKLTAAEKRKIKKLNNKLQVWDDDEESVPKSRTVVLKHTFTLEELAEDVSATIDIKDDIREGCEDIGPVTNVVLYDLEPEGVVTVKFKTSDDAEACVDVMNRRYFGGRQLEAHLLQPGEKYNRSKGDEEEESRLDKFGSWLEQTDEKEGQDGHNGQEDKE